MTEKLFTGTLNKNQNKQKLAGKQKIICVIGLPLRLPEIYTAESALLMFNKFVNKFKTETTTKKKKKKKKKNGLVCLRTNPL